MRAPLTQYAIYIAGAAAVLVLLRDPNMASAATPNGSQFQINTYTTNAQYRPSIASDSAGNFVVVWDSGGSGGSDTDGRSVQGQRYDATGSAIGAQFQVNAYTAYDQVNPSVASDTAGNFVVVWESQGSAGTDTAGRSIQGQRYDASGSAIGAQFQVNTYTTNPQVVPSVASDVAGNFVVVWLSFGSAGSDTSGNSVQGQRYDASGSAIGGQFQINTYTTNGQQLPRVASDSAGNFVVVWWSAGSAGSDTSLRSVQGQRYDASGSPIGGEFQVNTYTTNNQDAPQIANDAAGDFVVIWNSNGSASSDTSGTAVAGQLYEASGAAIGGEFQVNTYTTNNQGPAAVASDSAGQDFAVVWQSSGSSGSDTSLESVQGQRYLPEPPFVPSIGVMLSLVLGLAGCRGRRA